VEMPRRGMRVGNGANLKGAYWTVVTGLVPIKKQTAEFDVFQKALGETKDRDVPEYVGYRIERAEVTSDDPSDLAWQELKLGSVFEFMKKWSDTMPEIVKPAFIDPMFAMPLGPLVGQDWTDAVAHLPEVPLEPVVTRQSGGMMGTAEPAAERPAGEEDANGGFVKMGRPGVRGFGMGDDDDAPQQRPLGVGQKKFVEYVLFRFFDYTVQPEKRYVYRVKLGLRNPNYGILPKWLKDPTSTKRKLAQTDWTIGALRLRSSPFRVASACCSRTSNRRNLSRRPASWLPRWITSGAW
jgi:hypothetical protein